MKVNALVLLSALTSVATAYKCCQRCIMPGYKKFYSIDENFIYNKCEEYCIKAENYEVYKSFVPELKPADVEDPCFSLGYNQYVETEVRTNAEGSITLDKYKKPRGY